MFSKKPDLGNPAFNLKIVPSCQKLYCAAKSLYSYNEMMEKYRKAYENLNTETSFGHSILSPKHVTDMGYLMDGYVSGLPFHTGDIDMDENLFPLIKREDGVEIYEIVRERGRHDKISTKAKIPLIHMHIDNGPVFRMGWEYPYFTIEEIRVDSEIIKKTEKDRIFIENELLRLAAENECPEGLHVAP